MCPLYLFPTLSLLTESGTPLRTGLHSAAGTIILEDVLPGPALIQNYSFP